MALHFILTVSTTWQFLLTQSTTTTTNCLKLKRVKSICKEKHRKHISRCYVGKLSLKFCLANLFNLIKSVFHSKVTFRDGCTADNCEDQKLKQCDWIRRLNCRRRKEHLCSSVAEMPLTVSTPYVVGWILASATGINIIHNLAKAKRVSGR